MARVFDTDPVTRTRSFFHWDPVDEAAHIETRQDVTEIAEFNKALHAATDERAPWRGDMHHVASIPMTVYMELQQRGILNDDRAFRAWLNDADNRVFRTRPGRV